MGSKDEQKRISKSVTPIFGLKKVDGASNQRTDPQVSHKDVTNLAKKTRPKMSVISDSDKSSSSKLMDSEIKKQVAKEAKEASKAAAKAVKDAEKAAAKAVKEAEVAAAKAVKQAEKEAAKAAKKAEKAAKAEAKAAEPKVKKEKEKAAPAPLEAEIAELRLKFASLQEQCMSLQAKMDVIRAAVAL